MPSTSSKTPTPTTERSNRQRDIEIYRRFVAGDTYRTIGEAYGMTTQNAHYIVKKILKESQGSLEDQFEQIIAQYDELRKAYWEAAEAGDKEAANVLLVAARDKRKCLGLDRTEKGPSEVTIHVIAPGDLKVGVSSE